MALKTHLFRLVFCSILLVSAFLEFSAAGNDIGYGWRIIENPNDPKLVQIVKFAVAEHNKQANKNLKLVKVLKAESQLVEGMEYRFVISAKEGGGGAAVAPDEYVAVVWEKAWENFRKLISFERLMH
ncbi:cysteine proteinase inhibitor 1-like [Primulina huaijiensis]|uniref:cysteine proteinase inhibitor 1-like n=1 Tax=Primulina huaijiensis TaxID=1492673 RepID=UPI003CC709E0